MGRSSTELLTSMDEISIILLRKREAHDRLIDMISASQLTWELLSLCSAASWPEFWPGRNLAVKASMKRSLRGTREISNENTSNANLARRSGPLDVSPWRGTYLTDLLGKSPAQTPNKSTWQFKPHINPKPIPEAPLRHPISP